MPRYFGFESRPFLVVPALFLCAITYVRLAGMSIKEILEKINPFYGLILALLLASIFFAIGRLSVLEGKKEPIKVLYENPATVVLNDATTTNNQIVKDGPVIGSKSGKKYYFPWCGTVKRIKPENQVHFGSIEEARTAGFLPGGNCKGLK